MDAAGLLLDTGTRVLLLLRSIGSGSGTWGLPGGSLEVGETPYEAACRECCEEIGDLPPHRVVGTLSGKRGEALRRSGLRPLSGTRGDSGRRHPGVYTTYHCLVAPEQVKMPVRLNAEHERALWVPDMWVMDHRDDLHPGVFRAIRACRGF